MSEIAVAAAHVPDVPVSNPGRVDAESAGRLRLDVRRRGQRSYAARQAHEGALRVLRPHYLDESGQVSYTMINPGGAYFGADAYEIDIAVAEGASLLLTTQSATKIYRTPQGPATQRMTVELGPGAALESLPDQVIVYREGSYRQRTLVTMHPSASYVAAEVVTPGWSPDGGFFRYDELRLRTQVAVSAGGARRVFAVDQLRLVPDTGTTGIGVMEGHSHLGQLLVADHRVDDDLIDEVASIVRNSGLLGAVSRIGVPLPAAEPGGPVLRGMALRALGDRTEDLTALNLVVVDLLRARWRGQPPLDIRKY